MIPPHFPFLHGDSCCYTAESITCTMPNYMEAVDVVIVRFSAICVEFLFGLAHTHTVIIPNPLTMFT